jgi:recombinational DNA repair protein (RecF pathway)
MQTTETPDRFARVVELMKERDAIVAAMTEHHAKLAELAAECSRIDGEMRELTGMVVVVTTDNGDRKQMTCSHCKEKGHNKKGCPQLKEVP